MGPVSLLMRGWRAGLLLALGLGGTVSAQVATVRVQVTDQRTGEKLLGATVYYRQHTSLAKFTDLDGNAYLPRLAQADTVSVSYTGYKPNRFVCQPADSVHFVMLLAQTNLLETVRVSAKRPIAEEFVLKPLSFLDIVTNPTSFADPLLAVRSLPSSTNTDESATVSFRGNSPLATGIVLNDVPIYDVSKFAGLSGVGTFSIFPLPLLNDVMSFAANPPVEFGHASSGLIAVTTSDAQTPRFLNATLGLANSNLVIGQPIGKNWMVKAFVGFQSGQLLKSINPGSFQDIKTFNLTDGGWHIAWQKKQDSFKLYGYLLNENFANNNQFPGYVAPLESRKHRVLVTGQYIHRFSWGEFSANAGYSRSVATLLLGSFQEYKQPIDFFGGINGRYFLSESVSIKAGISTDQRQLWVQGQYPVYPGLFRPTDPTFGDTSTVRLHLYEGFVFLKYKPTRQWVFGGGTRHGWSTNGQSFGMQASARYNLRDEQFINLGAGQYYTYSLLQAGQYQFVRFASRQVSVDYSRTADRISVSASVFGQQQTQPSPMSIWGVEGSLKWTIGKRTTAQMSGSLIKSPVRTLADSALAVGGLASNRNGFYGRATVQRQVGNWTVAVSGTYHNQRFAASASKSSYSIPLDAYLPVRATNYQPLAAYWRCDATVNRMFSWPKQQLVCFLTMANLLNTANIRGLMYNMDYSESTNLYFQKRFIYVGISANIK